MAQTDLMSLVDYSNRPLALKLNRGLYYARDHGR